MRDERERERERGRERERERRRKKIEKHESAKRGYRINVRVRDDARRNAFTCGVGCNVRAAVLTVQWGNRERGMSVS